MGATLSQVLPLLREHYHDAITEIFFTADKTITPVMANMESKSMDDGAGRGYVVPIEYGLGSAAGPTFAIHQTKAQGATVGSAALRDRWISQHTTVDAIAYWSRDAMLAAAGKGADELFDVMQREMDAKIALVRKRLAHAAVEQGYGRVATITAAPTSTTITIGASSVNRLDTGDDLVAAAVHTSGGLRSATAVRVTQWDPDTGVITLSADPTALSWANGDTVFFEGYRDVTTPLMPFGLGSWVPTTAPGATTFNNVNRQGNPNLGGHRFNASGFDHSTALIRSMNRLFKFSRKPDICYVSPEDYQVLVADKDATKVVELKLGKYEIGFDGVTVRTHAGNVPVVPDAMLEQGTAWAGAFGDKKYAPFIAHNDDLVNIDDLDGNEITRAASSTNFEMRLFFRGNIIVPAPGAFIAIYNLPSS